MTRYVVVSGLPLTILQAREAVFLKHPEIAGDTHLQIERRMDVKLDRNAVEVRRDDGQDQAG